MSDRNASRTALAVAAMRAAHQIFDTPPLILDDPATLRLLGTASVRRIAENRDRYNSRPARALRAHLVLRSRFAEDRLLGAVRRGVGRCVILGAGLDTFAHRQPPWAESLQIVEVDHPGTQKAKRDFLANAGMAHPANLQYASIDFEYEPLREGLLRQGVWVEHPTFFCWLGVTMYLAEAAIDAVLRAVAKFPAGSEIVLTFSPPLAADQASHDGLEQLAATVADAGESWISYFTPEQIEAKLRAAGFATVEFLTPEDSVTSYFDGRTDLPVPRRTTIVAAVV